MLSIIAKKHIVNDFSFVKRVFEHCLCLGCAVGSNQTVLYLHGELYLTSHSLLKARFGFLYLPDPCHALAITRAWCQDRQERNETPTSATLLLHGDVGGCYGRTGILGWRMRAALPLIRIPEWNVGQGGM